MNLEDEKFKDVEVKGYKFRIRYISPRDRALIIQERMRLQNGNPVEALTQNDFEFFENIGIVNICTEEMPKGFKENESCMAWGDFDLINNLAQEIKNHTESLEAELKKNKPVAGIE
jgi:hypothetical protein